ncbi:thiol reductant ABC exporter subunit CydD [Streptomyces sp. NPDC001401]|uniref:thiol reductant ABC exporter subunit CydD n=1 Tax=Streptomyces sp. NPDC001401 TaxID=3364570 RepID=UPI003683959F
MKHGPLDAELVRIHPRVKVFLLVCTAGAALGGALVVAQALLLARVLAALFHGGSREAFAAVPVPLVAGVVAARCGLVWWERWYPAREATRVQQALRAELVEAAGRGRIRGAGPAPAAVVAVLTRGADALDGYVSGAVAVLPQAVVVPPTVVCTLLLLDVPSGLTVLVTLPFVPLVLAVVGLHTKARTERHWRVLLRLGERFRQAVGGLTTLRVFGRQDDAARRIRAAAAEHRVVTMAALRQAFLSSFVLETMTTLAVALIAVPVGFRLLAGDMPLTAGLAVLLLTPEAYRPLRSLALRFHASQEGRAVLEQARRIRAAAPVPVRPAAPGPHPVVEVPSPALTPLVLDRLTVGFPGGPPVLREVSLTLEPGRCHALTGPSGAGKSTLLRTLAGQLAPLGGEIRIGSHPLPYVPGAAWGDVLGVVPQRPHLFAMSLADNVRLGRPGAGPDEVWQALAAAGAADFVAALPDGPATLLGDGGAQLSAGERQRIALARALLRRPALLLLDEPTARLDGQTEQRVLDALRALAGTERTTVLVVTHRPRVMEHADTVFHAAHGSVDIRPRLREGQPAW